MSRLWQSKHFVLCLVLDKLLLGQKVSNQFPISNLFFAVRGFGIIGGGAVLFSAAAVAGAQTFLPWLGEEKCVCNIKHKVSNILNMKIT